MSLFGDNQYRWRETYFVLFDSGKRPTLKAVEKALSALDDRYVLKESCDEDGQFDSLTLLSPHDFAALDICYICGDEVIEQTMELAGQVESAACDLGESISKEQLTKYGARFDVLHFEHMADAGESAGDDSSEELDPSALLLVLGALAKLTGGIAIDPQTATVLSNEGE